MAAHFVEGDYGGALGMRISHYPTHYGSWAGEAHRTGMYEQAYVSFALGLTYGVLVSEEAGLGLFATFEMKAMSTYAEMRFVDSEKDFLVDHEDEDESKGVNIGLIGWRDGLGYSVAYDSYHESFVFGLVF